MQPLAYILNINKSNIRVSSKQSMNYFVAVLSDRIQAEAAYTVLEKEGLPKDQVTMACE